MVVLFAVLKINRPLIITYYRPSEISSSGFYPKNKFDFGFLVVNFDKKGEYSTLML